MSADAPCKRGHRDRWKSGTCRSCQIDRLDSRDPGRVARRKERERKDRLRKAGRKECPACGQIKSVDEFYLYKRRGRLDRQYLCISCQSIHGQAKRFGVSPEELALRFVEQGEVCYLCKTDDPGRGRWNVDHDHACTICGGSGCSSCIRGIAHMKCNLGIGHFDDDPALMRVVADSLEEVLTA